MSPMSPHHVHSRVGDQEDRSRHNATLIPQFTGCADIDMKRVISIESNRCRKFYSVTEQILAATTRTQ